uniref:Uncharacterized protein n=1 Tax=Rhizophora mucronata TaxID=61149 RepID=A0A2P2PDZ3_RHIMU
MKKTKSCRRTPKCSALTKYEKMEQEEIEKAVHR